MVPDTLEVAAPAPGALPPRGTDAGGDDDAFGLREFVLGLRGSGKLVWTKGDVAVLGFIRGPLRPFGGLRFRTGRLTGPESRAPGFRRILPAGGNLVGRQQVPG